MDDVRATRLIRERIAVLKEDGHLDMVSTLDFEHLDLPSKQVIRILDRLLPAKAKAVK